MVKLLDKLFLRFGVRAISMGAEFAGLSGRHSFLHHCAGAAASLRRYPCLIEEPVPSANGISANRSVRIESQLDRFGRVAIKGKTDQMVSD